MDYYFILFFPSINEYIYTHFIIFIIFKKRKKKTKFGEITYERNLRLAELIFGFQKWDLHSQEQFPISNHFA